MHRSGTFGQKLYVPLLETIIVIYSPLIFENSPRRKPFGWVVVKPTRIYSFKVDLHEPGNSYRIIELSFMVTPISAASHSQDYFEFWYVKMRSYDSIPTVGTNGSLECCPTTIARVATVTIDTRSIIQAGIAIAFTDASNRHTCEKNVLKYDFSFTTLKK